VNQRTRDLLLLGLFLFFGANTIVGWFKGGLDLTLVSTSTLGLIGLIIGAKPWSRPDPPKPPPPPGDEEAR